MLEPPAAAALNHLLRERGWARAMLQPFASKCVAFSVARLPELRLVILDSGLVAQAPRQTDADLLVTVHSAALPYLLARDDAAMAHIDLAGPVNLAGVVQVLFRELEWDAEQDMSRLLGDVLAHRVVGTARGALAWQKDAALRLAQNLAEYLTTEHPLLANAGEAAGLRRGLDAVNEHCGRLDRRIAVLEARMKR